MDSAKICAAALIFVGAAAIIKQVCSNFVFPLRAAGLMIFAAALLIFCIPAVDYINELFELTGFSRYALVIMKGFGIAVLCHGCAAVCRDCGEGTVGECVELAGKIEIFILCIPFINELLAGAQELIFWQ